MRTYKWGVYGPTAMLAGEIPSKDMPVQLTKVKGEKGTYMGQLDIYLFRWKEKFKEWVEKAKILKKETRSFSPCSKSNAL